MNPTLESENQTVGLGTARIGVQLAWAVGFAAVLATAGCVTVNLHRDTPVTTTDGASVQRVIDKRLAAYLKSEDANLTFAPSRCPATIDVGGGNVQHCILPIDGVDIPVKVVSGAPSQLFKVDLDGGVIDTHAIEWGMGERVMAENHLKVTAVCPPPRIHLIKTGEVVRCTIYGLGRASHFDVKLMPSGKFWTSRPSGVRDPQWFTDTLSRHKQGRTTQVSGAAIAGFIEEGGREKNVMAAQKLSSVKVECPPVLDLSRKNHAVCTSRVKGLTVHYDVSIDDVNGLRYSSLDLVVDGNQMEHLMAKDMNEQLSENGYASSAAVACKHGIYLVQVGVPIFCDVTIGGKWNRLQVDTQADGSFRWHIAAGDAASSPAATH